MVDGSDLPPAADGRRVRIPARLDQARESPVLCLARVLFMDDRSMLVTNIQDRSPLGAAGTSRTADVGRGLGDFVVFSLSFTRLAPNVPATVKWPRLFHGNFFPGRDQNELILVRRLGANFIGLVANSDPRPPWEGMLVVIHHLLPRAAVDHRVVPFYTRPFLPFIGGQGNRVKFNPLDGLIGSNGIAST